MTRWLVPPNRSTIAIQRPLVVLILLTDELKAGVSWKFIIWKVNFALHQRLCTTKLNNYDKKNDRAERTRKYKLNIGIQERISIPYVDLKVYQSSCNSALYGLSTFSIHAQCDDIQPRFQISRIIPAFAWWQFIKFKTAEEGKWKFRLDRRRQTTIIVIA